MSNAEQQQGIAAVADAPADDDETAGAAKS